MFGKRNGLDIPAFGNAHFASPEEMEAAALLGDKGIRLGYYRTPGDRRGWGRVVRYNGDAGLMMVAPPRKGKARDVLVGALLEYPQSCIVVDPKGQLAAITKAHRERPKSEGGLGQRVFVLNPFNIWPDILGASAHYNPMMLLDPASKDWSANCAKLAEGLIARDNEKDSHWTSGARSLLTGIIGQLAAHGRDGKKNLAEVRRIITEDFDVEDPETKKIVRKPLLVAVAQAAMQSPHAFIRQALASYANENPRNPGELESFKQNAREQTFFLGMDTMGENLSGAGEFRFADLKETPTTVYIILPDNMLDVCGKWFRLVIASALDDLWRGEKGTYRVLAILDEFAQVGHLKVLEDSAGAAAGRGVQLWPVIQNIPQLKKDYGEVWETFLSGSDIRQFFAPQDQTTAKYISETVGQRTVTTAGQSVQDNGPFGDNRASDSSGQAGQPLIRPHEISGFGLNESLIIGPQNIIVDGLRQPYFHTPEFNDLYAPDPMHKRDAAPPPSVRPETIITFADTLAAGAERTAAARAAKRPVFLRLLTWGSSRNPTLNALRKAEYVLTLPLRIPAALLAAPFAIHNKPLGAVIGFVALFGFWELFDGLAKGPFVELYEQKVHEYEFEETAHPRYHSTGNDMYSHYRAAKWLITEALPPAVSFALKRDNPSYGTGIDGMVRRMSVVLDYEHSLSDQKDFANVEQTTHREMDDKTNWIRSGPGPDPTLIGLSPQQVLFEKLKARQDAAAPSVLNPLNWWGIVFPKKPDSIFVVPAQVHVTAGGLTAYTASDIPAGRPGTNVDGSRGKDFREVHLGPEESFIFFCNEKHQRTKTTINGVEFYVGSWSDHRAIDVPILVPVTGAENHIEEEPPPRA